MAYEVDPDIPDPSGNGGGELFQFLIQGLGITITASFGIIGNILSLIVITRPKLKSSITWLLIGLSAFDLIFLILNILIYSLIATFTYLDIGKGYISVMDPVQNPFLVTINDTAQTASVYFTLFIALERYLVVKWPVESRSFCTYERCRIAALCVFLFSCAYQGFRLLSTGETAMTNLELDEWWANCPEHAVTNSSEPGADEDYEVYFFRWPYMTFIMILPSTLLIFLNGSIWHTVVIAHKKKKLTTVSKKSDEKERSITIMLLVVVLVFLICQLAFYVMAIIHQIDLCAWKSVNVYLISVDLFLITLNSSVNFLIYCTFGTNFRNQFKRLLCTQRVREAMGYGMSMESSTGSGTKMTSTVNRRVC